MTQKPLTLPMRFVREISEALSRSADAHKRLVRQGPQAHRQLRPTFEPWFAPGETVHVVRTGGTVDVLITAVEALPLHKHDFGAIASRTNDQDPVHLDVLDGEMAQYRFFIRDAFQVEIKNPPSQVRGAAEGGTTVNFRVEPSFLDPNTSSQERDWMFAASELWVFEQEAPRFDLIPLGSGQSVQGYMDFVGIKYAFETIENEGEHLLRTNGWPS